MTTSIVAGAVGQEATIVGGNDGTLTLISGAVGSKVNALTIDGAGAVQTIGNLTVAGKISQTTPASMVQVALSNGFGSTNTAIWRFTTVEVSQGSDITYTSSAANGDSFTINTSGVYAVTYTNQFNAALWMGLSLDASGADLTTHIYLISQSKILNAFVTAGANIGGTSSTTRYFAAGSVIRAHNATSLTAGSATAGVKFTITRVS